MPSLGMRGGRIPMHGKTFGRLTVIGRTHKVFPERGSGKNIWWWCRCECGNKLWVQGRVMRSGHTKSCGCYHAEVWERVKKKPLSLEEAVRAKERARVYSSWEKMLVRCYDKSHEKYKSYGGRGISVCKRWKESFDAFYADLGDRPKDRTLGRRDNNGNYEPGNCRWETWEEQAYNRRNTVRVVYDPRKGPETLGQLSKRFGMDRNIVHQRVVVHGWDLHKALTTLVRAKRPNHSA